MPKDYAKYPYRSRRTLAEGWAWRLLLVIVVLAVMSFGFYTVYLYNRLGLSHPFQWWMTHAKLVFSHKNVDSVPPVLPEKKVTPDNAPQEVHFDFYTDLPNMKMKVRK